MARDRYAWIDIAKGIAIILVVIGHAWRGLNSAGIVPEDLFLALDARIYAFHMPVFFALSGFFVARSLAAPPAKYVQSRIIRLLWPMVLWTYIFLLFKLAAGSAANTPVVVEDLLIWPIPGYLHLWFLWALFLLHLSLLMVRPLMAGPRLPASVLVGLSFVAVTAAILAQEGPNWTLNAARHAPFLVLGMWAGHIGLGQNVTAALRGAAVLVFAGLVAAVPMIPAQLDLAVSIALTATFLVGLAGLGQSNSRGFFRPLIALGKASMAIYLMHTIFSAGFRTALFKLGVDGLWPHMIVGVGVGLILPLVGLYVARRLGLVRVLGL